MPARPTGGKDEEQPPESGVTGPEQADGSCSTTRPSRAASGSGTSEQLKELTEPLLGPGGGAPAAQQGQQPAALRPCKRRWKAEVPVGKVAILAALLLGGCGQAGVRAAVQGACWDACMRCSCSGTHLSFRPTLASRHSHPPPHPTSLTSPLAAAPPHPAGVVVSDTLRAGLPCPSLPFWVAALSMVPVTLVVLALVRAHLIRAYRQRTAAPGYLPAEGEVAWTPRTTLVYPALCTFAGLVAGVFGVGGGIVVSEIVFWRVNCCMASSLWRLRCCLCPCAAVNRGGGPGGFALYWLPGCVPIPVASGAHAERAFDAGDGRASPGCGGHQCMHDHVSAGWGDVGVKVKGFECRPHAQPAAARRSWRAAPAPRS